MATIAERIRQLRGNLSLASFAEMVGVSKSTLSRYEQGDGFPDAKVIETLCTITGNTADWLIFGTNPYPHGGVADEEPEGGYPIQNMPSPDEKHIVMVSKVQARLSAGGGSLEANGDPVGSYAFRSDWLIRKGQAASMVLMDVVGDSMAPAIEDGDMVLIDQSQRGVVPGAIYAVGVESGVYVKRVDLLPGTLVLNSINPSYCPIEVPLRGDLADTVRVIGRVIWWCREAK